MSFRQRLGLFLVATLVAVQCLTAVFAYSYLRHDLVERGKRELTAAMQTFAQQLDFISERVASGVQVLSLDFALRSAIAQQDYTTELSALRNHGHRIGATRMMIVSLDGRVTADTSQMASGEGFLYRDLLSRAVETDKSAALATVNGEIYWIVVVPVRAPVPIAFIAAYIPVDDALLNKLRDISSVPQSIVLATVGTNGHWLIASESSMHLHHVNLPTTLSIATSSSVITENGEDYLSVVAPIRTPRGSAPIAAMMDYPLNEALASYRAMVTPMLLVMFLGLAAMLIGAGLIVRSVSRPLEMLAVAARRIAQGDYSPPPRFRQRDELGQLGDALGTMTSAISARETELRDAVAAMEFAKNEAVKANRAKSQFLSNMSHELRTPLNAIVGFSEMIREEIMGPIGVPRYLDYARDIHGAGEHLLVLIERMLDLSEAEANRLVISRETLSARAQIEKALLQLTGFAEESDVALSCDVNAAKQLQIEGDSRRLHEAFFNLLHNAIRFTPSGGRVSISCDADAKQLKVTIRDTGIGMAPELLETVVQPFHRLRSAFDGKEQGAGIGLAFAKKVIELHRGSLCLESAEGKGTTATIRLPLFGEMRKVA